MLRGLLLNLGGNSRNRSRSRVDAAHGLNQYTGAGSLSLSYDPNGNLTGTLAPAQAGGTTSYRYDRESRLIGASGGSTASLIHDPLGRPFSVTGSVETRFLYDPGSGSGAGGDELVAEYDGSNNLLRRYVHGLRDDDPFVWFEGSGTGKVAR